MQILLDTHVFYWLLVGSNDLRSRSDLEQAAVSGSLFVSPITCWEIGMLASRGRIHLEMSCSAWIAQALRAPGICLLELAPEMAVQASYLPGDFHGDPADRMLVASARVGCLTLATRDAKILTYGKEGHVRVLAC